MRTDYKILREIIDGFSDPDAAPTSDGLAARRPRRPLGGEALDASVLEQDGPYRHDVRRTFERRSSTTDYAPEPLDAGPLLASVRAALVEDAETWGRDAAAVALEPFVLLLRPRGARPGVYRVRPDGADLDRADAWAGAHGYRHAMARAAAVIYSVHLRSAARGLTGTVFAGLSPSAVRHLLDSDGVSRHQMLAVTVAVPTRAAPSP